jgi:hypothetical protein
MTMHIRTGGVCTTTTNSLKRSACGKLPMVNPPAAAANHYTIDYSRYHKLDRISSIN